jgi:2-oxoglutarate ferredoxin oxidoreductase subunit alpha
VIKVNSHTHDESGITTEEAGHAHAMQDKWARKEAGLTHVLESMQQVNTLGSPSSSTVLLCWGSTRGACAEAGEILGLRVVQPVVLWPFPADAVKRAIAGARQVIAVEHNATGQLAALAARYGITVTDSIRRYDGRSFSIDELVARITAVVA